MEKHVTTLVQICAKICTFYHPYVFYTLSKFYGMSYPRGSFIMNDTSIHAENNFKNKQNNKFSQVNDVDINNGKLKSVALPKCHRIYSKDC